MKKRFLALALLLSVLLICNYRPHGSLVAQAPSKTQDLDEKLSEVDRILTKADTGLDGHELAEAMGILVPFVTENPQHGNVGKALQVIAAHLPQPASEQNRKELIRMLRALASEGEDSRQHNLAIQFINAQQSLIGWRFGNTAEQIEPKAAQRIIVETNENSRLAEFPPKYRLFSIPRAELAKHIDKYRNQNSRAASEVDREKWQSVEIRSEIYMPAIDSAAIKASRFQFGNSVTDTIHADLSEGGVYVLEQEIEGFRKRLVIHAPKFAMFAKKVGGELVVCVADPWSGSAIADMQIESWAGDEGVRKTTDERGIAVLPNLQESHLVAQLGNDIQTCEVPFIAEEEVVGEFAFITTDRSIYRPGQLVNFKVVARKPDTPWMKFSDQKTLKIEIRDPKGRLLDGQQLEMSSHGTVSGSFRLSDEPALGTYHVVAPIRKPLAEHEDDLGEFAWKENWSTRFEVAEYRKPEMEVSIYPHDESTTDKKIEALVNAQYYFGGATADANVEWTVEASIQYGFKTHDQLKPFEDPRAWFYETQPMFGDYSDHSYSGGGSGFFGGGGGGFGGGEGGGGAYYDNNKTVIARGAGVTDATGNLKISFSKPASFYSRYTINATVRDASRLTATGSTTIDTDSAAVDITVGTTRLFYVNGEEIEARVRMRSHDGQPLSAKNVELTAFTRTDSPENEEFESFETRMLKTDNEGLVIAKFVAPREGTIRLRARYTTEDKRTAVARTQFSVVTEGDDSERVRNEIERTSRQNNIWSGTHDAISLELQTDLLAYEKGESIRLLVETPVIPDTALLLIEGEEVHLAKTVKLSRTAEIIDIEVENDWPPRVRINLIAWKDGSFDRGSTDVAVYPGKHILNVDVESDRPTYAPREKAKVTIKVADHRGEPIRAEVELAIVDESLFALAEDQSGDIRSFFYPSPALSSGYAEGYSSLYPYYTVVEDRFKSIQNGYDSGMFGGSGGGMGGGGFGGGGGGGGFGGFGGGGGMGGGGGPQPFATSVTPGVGSAPFAETEIRNNFAGTFYWAGHVKVGSVGRAEVEIEVPDTLTEWRIVARAVSGSQEFGAGTSNIVTRKDTIARLSAPRFLTEGDKTIVSSVVRNNTEREASYEIEFSVEEEYAGRENAKPIRKETRKIAAGGQVRVDWPVNVSRAGVVTFRTKASSTASSDAMELRVPVRPFGIEKRLAINGRLENGKWKTSINVPQDANLDSAELHIVVSSASTQAIQDALPYLAGYPYGCVEQTMSRFLPAVVASTAMKRQKITNSRLSTELPEMVQLGLQRLYSFQHDDGGWGWWKHDETDQFMTTYVLYGLLIAKEAGYSIDPQVLEEGIFLLEDFETTPFALHVKKLAGVEFDFDPGDVHRVFGSPKTRLDRAADDPFSPASDSDDPFDSSPDAGGDDSDNPFGNIFPQEHANVFVSTSAKSVNLADSYSTEDIAWLVLAGYDDLAKHLPSVPPTDSGPDQVQAISLAIYAMAKVDRSDPRIGTLVDWLMQQRRGGAWHSTLDTAYAVFALSEISQPNEGLSAILVFNGERIKTKGSRFTIPAGKLKHDANSIELKSDANQTVYASALLRYFGTDVDKPSEDATGMTVRRVFERSVTVKGNQQWAPIASGDKVVLDDEIRMTTFVESGERVERIMIESPIPAGTEPHEDELAVDERQQEWFDQRELRDDRVSVATGELFGKTSFSVRLRPTTPGNYHVLPARAFPMYQPDQQGNSTGFSIVIADPN